MKNFYNLFIKELQNVYSVEKQIIAALPKMIEGASSSKLKEALRHHLKETKEQLKRLNTIALELGEGITGFKSDAIAGLIKDGSKVLRAHYDKPSKDAAIISACQRIEHYEIAVYGVLKALARHLNLRHVEELLIETAKEEGHANKTLTELAEGNLFSSGINEKACKKVA